MIFRVGVVLIFALGVLLADDLSESESRLIDLNVIAVDIHGRPVSDLTSDDFQVNDAGKPQKISFFRHNDRKLWRTPSLGPNEFSNRAGAEIPHATVILFDLLNERFGARGYAWNQLVHDLEPLETADYLYLYVLTVDGRLYVVHGLAGEEGKAPQPGAVAWTSQIKPLMNQAMRAVTRTRPVDIDVAVRVQLTYVALNALAAQLSRVPGRKNIVWITDGVPIALGPNRSDTGDFVDFTEQLRQLSEGLDRSGVAIYPVRQVMLGNNAGAGVSSEATLDDFAGLTGGRPDMGKDIGAALRQAMDDLRVSYQIGYYVPWQSLNGKFHKLRVACKRKGVRIQAKTGYYAWPDPPGAKARQAIDAAISTPFDAAEIGLRGTLSTNPQAERMAHLEVRIDAKDVALGHEGDQYTGQLRLAVAGYQADGRIEDSAVVPLDLHYSAQERDKALNEGIAFSDNVMIGKKLNKVRLIVFDRGSNAIGSLTIPVNTGSRNQAE
jgi:VWFA-related protein